MNDLIQMVLDLSTEDLVNLVTIQNSLNPEKNSPDAIGALRKELESLEVQPADVAIENIFFSVIDQELIKQTGRDVTEDDRQSVRQLLLSKVDTETLERLSDKLFKLANDKKLQALSIERTAIGARLSGLLTDVSITLKMRQEELSTSTEQNPATIVASDYSAEQEGIVIDANYIAAVESLLKLQLEIERLADQMIEANDPSNQKELAQKIKEADEKHAALLKQMTGVFDYSKEMAERTKALENENAAQRPSNEEDPTAEFKWKAQFRQKVTAELAQVDKVKEQKEMQRVLDVAVTNRKEIKAKMKQVVAISVVRETAEVDESVKYAEARKIINTCAKIKPIWIKMVAEFDQKLEEHKNLLVKFIEDEEKRSSDAKAQPLLNVEDKIKQSSAEQLYPSRPNLQAAVENYKIIQRMQNCLREEKKPAQEKLQSFTKTFLTEGHKLKVTGSKEVEGATKGLFQWLKVKLSWLSGYFTPGKKRERELEKDARMFGKAVVSAASDQTTQQQSQPTLKRRKTI